MVTQGLDLGASNEYFCKVEVTPVIIDTASDYSKAEIAVTQVFYQDCRTMEKPIVAGKLNPGESIGYFGEMEVLTVRMNTGLQCSVGNCLRWYIQ